jgi:two-component system, LuxR family, response regulator FixJ
VDDDDAVRDSLRLLLESHGYDVDAFNSATTCLEERRSRSYDCFLVDLHMPGKSGIDLIETLRASGEDAPTFIITSRMDPKLAARVKRADVFGVLSKPVADRELISWLGRAGCGPVAHCCATQ